MDLLDLWQNQWDLTSHLLHNGFALEPCFNRFLSVEHVRQPSLMQILNLVAY